MIDTTLIKMLRADIVDAIKDIGKEHGVILEVSPGSYSTNNFTFKVEGGMSLGNGNVMTKEAVAYRNYSMHEQTGVELFDKFRDGSRRFKVIGYKTRASKRPIVCRNLDTGRDHIFPTGLVKRLAKMGGVVN